MDLSSIQFPLQARRPWSALDLGFAMARRWWLGLFLLWLIPASAIYLTWLLIFPNRSWIGLLLAWWCKPLLEQLILFRASRLIFNEETSIRATWRQFFTIVKTDWLWWITLRRFSATRSFDMPVTTLERLRGGERQRRKSVLQLRNAGPAMWLTVLMVHLETLLVYGVLGFIVLMLPEHVDVDWLRLLSADFGSWRYLSDALTLLIMASMAPFYTLAGFSLYLNRRVELEGWDIELHFQQILAANTSRGRNAIIASVIIGLLAWMPVGTRFDASDAATLPTPAESQERIQTILADDAFHEKRTVSRWQRKDLEQVEEESDSPAWVDFLLSLGEGLADSVKLIASVFEVLLWLLVAGIVCYLLYRYRQDLRRAVRLFSRREQQTKVPEVLLGMPVTEESVPDDVVGEARALWRKQRQREAVSLLYRASLSRLLHRYQCPFTPADTERECVRRVDALGMAGVTRFMHDLTLQWERIAYGHREVAKADFDRLCSNWQSTLGA